MDHLLRNGTSPRKISCRGTVSGRTTQKTETISSGLLQKVPYKQFCSQGRVATPPDRSNAEFEPCTQEFVRRTTSAKFSFGKLYFVQSNGDFAKLSTEKSGNHYARISCFTKWQASRSAVRRTQEPGLPGLPLPPKRGVISHFCKNAPLKKLIISERDKGGMLPRAAYSRKTTPGNAVRKVEKVC